MRGHTVIFENQFIEFLSIYQYIEFLGGYTAFPKEISSKNGGDIGYSDFSNLFRIWANPRYGERREKAFKKICCYLTLRQPLNIIMDQQLITGHDGKNGLDLCRKLLGSGLEAGSWSLKNINIIFVSKIDRSEVQTELDKLKREFTSPRIYWIKKSLAEIVGDSPPDQAKNQLKGYYDEFLRPTLSKYGGALKLIHSQVNTWKGMKYKDRINPVDLENEGYTEIFNRFTNKKGLDIFVDSLNVSDCRTFKEFLSKMIKPRILIGELLDQAINELDDICENIQSTK